MKRQEESVARQEAMRRSKEKFIHLLKLYKPTKLKLTRVRACLHVPSPCPSPSPSEFITVPMETDRLTGRMGTEPILPVNLTNGLSPLTQCKFYGDRDSTCKQAFRSAC